MAHTKTEIVAIYNTLKAQSGGSLKYRDFLRKAGIPKHEFRRMFGATPYSKLQQLAGDSPNRLDLQRTPLEAIMSAYGDLACEVLRDEGRLPVAAHWAEKGLRPTESGLRNAHGIRWSELPGRFLDFCAADDSLAARYEAVLGYIREHDAAVSAQAPGTRDLLLDSVCSEIGEWSPALRRNSEEAYKSELSLHLRSSKQIRAAGLDVREERGDTRCDIALGTKVAIELKKSPSQSEYDRCFGQVARHLQVYDGVVVVIFDVPRRDSFEDFNKLVDLYFTGRVRVVRNG